MILVKVITELIILMKTTNPAIGIDIDGTIDEIPDFFRILTKLWPGPVYIITMHGNHPKAIAYLSKLNILYDYIFVVNSFQEKVEIIRDKKISVYFDDMDEVIGLLPEEVKVLKVRNQGNFSAGKWLFNQQTGFDISSDKKR